MLKLGGLFPPVIVSEIWRKWYINSYIESEKKLEHSHKISKNSKYRNEYLIRTIAHFQFIFSNL